MSLTPEAQKIAESRQINLNRPVDELLALLKALAHADQIAEKTAKRWGCSAGLIGLVGLVASIIWMNVKKHHLERGGTLLAVTIVVVIVCIVMYKRAKKGDLADNFRKTAFPFLTVLREDLPPDGKIHVKIDLREAAIKEKLKSESQPHAEAGYYQVIDQIYEDPWFSGEAVLVDGTSVGWDVTEIIHQKHKRKRNPRGKIKMKTKTKRKTLARVAMTFAEKEFTINTAGDNVKGKKRSLKLWKTEKTDGAESPAFQMLVDLIADGYRRTSVAESA
jgi:hypothetical protein